MSEGVVQEMTEKKRIVVTGGAGSIGSALCKELATQGHDVVVMDKRVPNHSHGRFVYTTLENREQFQPVLEGAEVLCHLGEIPSMVRGMEPNEVFATNVRTTSMVFQTAADLKIPRIIYTSSCQVYGIWGMNHNPPDRVMPTRLPFDETEPVKPINAYAISKVASEMYLKHLVEVGGLSAAALRFPATWDITDDGWLRKWWHRQSHQFAEGYWSYLHTADAVAAFVGAIDRAKSGFEVYHFVAKRIVGDRPLRQRIPEFYPKGPALPADWPDLDTPIDCSKAQRDLGWSPRFDLGEFVRQLDEAESKK
jgi:nucleoside-diphosphate-sugar epimerase